MKKIKEYVEINKQLLVEMKDKMKIARRILGPRVPDQNLTAMLLHEQVVTKNELVKQTELLERIANALEGAVVEEAAEVEEKVYATKEAAEVEDKEEGLNKYL